MRPGGDGWKRKGGWWVDGGQRVMGRKRKRKGGWWVDEARGWWLEQEGWVVGRWRPGGGGWNRKGGAWTGRSR